MAASYALDPGPSNLLYSLDTYTPPAQIDPTRKKGAPEEHAGRNNFCNVIIQIFCACYSWLQDGVETIIWKHWMLSITVNPAMVRV